MQPSLEVRAAVRQGRPQLTLGAAPAPEPAPPIGGKLGAGEVNLSHGALVLSDELALAVKDGGDLEVKARLPGLAEGTLPLRKRGDTFSTVREQAILLRHPALARFASAHPTVLALAVKENRITGWVGLGAPGPVAGSKRSLPDAITKSAHLLGWAGLSKITVPAFRNQFVDGVIDVALENLAFTVGGFLTAGGSAALDNQALAFDGSAKIQIPGGSAGELLIKKDPTGALAGKLDILVQIGGVAGTVTATLASGFVSIMGSVAYSGDRLSGKVTLVATDEATARDITLKKPEGGGDVPIELPGPDKPAKPGKRAFCGWGQLTFRVTDWLAGTAAVIVNSKGQATIVGEIAPPKEFILFEQKEWIKRILKLEIRAGYGIPVVGQVAIFANVSLDAIAKVGPGKLYNIKLSGAYSTDPRVAKQLAIEGTLNISAFAGLRLRAEAGLVVTIIAHDIKAGVGLNAIAGVRGYVEATPRIGMREPTPGKRQYYIQGHLEIAAQPVLGFSGDLFVELETPWWSPLSDKRWTWPLFSLEYPLPGEFGIGADVDYVLGSKQWPKIEFGEVNFDSSKFLTDVMNDNTDKGSGAEAKKPGDWKEGLGGKGPGGAKNKGGTGKKPGEVDSDNEPVGESLTFSDGKESHRLWFAEKPGAATLMVASKEENVSERLARLKTRVVDLLEGDRSRANSLIKQAGALLPNIQDEGRQVAVMKQAERKAEEAYKRHGKSKGKAKGKKPNRKDKNKKLKGDERKLEGLLTELFALMRMEPFDLKPRSVTWSASLLSKGIRGVEPYEVMRGAKGAGLRLAKMEGVGALDLLLEGVLGGTKNPAGRNATTTTRNKLLTEVKSLAKIPIAGNEVQAKAKVELLKIVGRIPPLVAELGEKLKVGTLSRATKVLPKAPWPVQFNVNKTPNEGYEKQFKDELKKQLDDQQAELNQLTVDAWVARIDTYKAKNLDEFKRLDRNARKAVAAEIRIKLDESEPVASQEVPFLRIARANLDEFLKKYAPLSKLTKEQRKRFHLLEFFVKEAEKIGPARAALKEFLTKHPNLSTLSKADKEEFVRLSSDAKLVGRSGQEKEFEKLHEEGIREVANIKQKEEQWEAWRTETKRLYAILHNPDQVAGGHGTVASILPVKKPVPPTDASREEEAKYAQDLKAWKKYLDDLRKFVGSSWINSIIGGNWGNIMKTLKGDITSLPNYFAPTYGLWRMNLSLRSKIVSK